MTHHGIGCRNLQVHAGPRLLLHIPQLQVPTGTTLAVLGPNGAGKSTLLRALARLGTHRISGDILLDDHPVTRTELRQVVTAVLQRPILSRGTVAANAATGLRFHGLSRRAAAEQAAPWMHALGVAHLANRDVRTLSGGEAQRVSLTRALATRPRVLLLDEPFTGLDATTRADLIADLRAVLHDTPTATVLVTHERHEAAALADHTALLIDGRLRQHGPTPDVLDQPTDPDTARLLGYTNLIQSDHAGTTATLAAQPEHTRLDLAPHAAAAHTTSEIGRDPTNGALLRVSGRLRRIVAMGAVTRIDINTPSGPITCLQPGDLNRNHLPAVGAIATAIIHKAVPLHDHEPPLANNPRAQYNR